MPDDPLMRFLQVHVALSVWFPTFAALLAVAFGLTRLLDWLKIKRPRGVGLQDVLAICMAVSNIRSALVVLLRDIAYYNRMQRAGAILLFAISLSLLLFIALRMTRRPFSPVPSWRSAILMTPFTVALCIILFLLVFRRDMMDRDRFIILLTEFSKGATLATPDDRRIFVDASDKIRNHVQAIEPTAKCVTLSEVVIDPDRARQLGQNAGADIVGWGWYSIDSTPDDWSIHFDFAPIAAPPGYVHPRAETFYPLTADMNRIQLVASVASHLDYIANFLLGLQRYGAADYDGAITRFTGSLQAVQPGDPQPDYAPVFFYRGNAWAGKGDPDKAIADYDQAIRLLPDDPDKAKAYGNRGNAWSDKGDLDKAIADFDLAINLFPEGSDKAKAYGNRALAWRTRGALDKAIADYDQAIRLFPDGHDKASAYINRGFAWAAKGELDKAIADDDQAIRLFTDDSDRASAYTIRGTTWAAKGDLDMAIADVDQAILIFPDGPGKAKAYTNRGVVWVAKGDVNKAIADFDQAIRYDPNDARAYNNRGIAWQARGDPEKAIADYDEAIHLDPNNFAAYYNRACLEARRGQAETALQWLAQAIERNPAARAMARANPDFTSLAADPRFKSLIGD